MKKFKSKKYTKRKIDCWIILICIITLVLLHYYNRNISDKVIDIASSKLEEISTIYIKRDIAPRNVNLNSLIKVNLNSNSEIVYVDIDTDYAREIMVEIVGRIQNNINKLKNGKFDNIINMQELKIYKNNVYLEVPTMLFNNGVLLQSLGPKVPVKLSFYEFVFGNINTEVIEYGINNAMIKIYLEILLEQKIIIPYKEKKFERNYSILIGSKIITGKVPSIYGSSLKTSSPILEI